MGGKQLFKGVEIQTDLPTDVFKEQLFSLTEVPPERQKVMIPRSGQLKDGTSWDNYKIKEGMTIMLVGSVGDIKAPEEKTVFIEDLPNQENIMAEHSLGLVNTGNTCYLNSSIQALSVVEPLREALVEYGKREYGESLPRQLGTLMRTLQNKEEALLPLSRFLLEFRSAYPQFAEQSPDGGGYMQQDAEEAFSLLLQSMQSVRGKNENIVDELFGGEFMVNSICTENPDEPNDVAVEPFHKLSVHIEADTNFLQSALKNRMTEHITKASPSLGRDAVYEKSRKISQLPSYLNLQFVRFFWRQDKNLRAKICKPVGFSFRLDLFEFCTEELQQKLAPKRAALLQAEEELLQKKKDALHNPKKEEEKEDVKMEEAESAVTEVVRENDTGLYDLVAVVSHRGRSADGGHYVAWVKQSEDKWLLYDDDVVSPVTGEEVKKLTGHGGADWHIAYLCVYQSVRSDSVSSK